MEVLFPVKLTFYNLRGFYFEPYDTFLTEKAISKFERSLFQGVILYIC